MVGRHCVGLLTASLAWGLTLASAAAMEGAVSIEIEHFDYADQAALGAVWEPESDSSPMPEVVIGADGQPVARFKLPFSTLKDWRVAWDREGAVDLSRADRILIRMRTDDPGAGVCMLYAHSGEGWYNFPQVGVASEWRTTAFILRDGGKEQKPGGWEGVDKIRLAFAPGSNRDATVEVAWIRAAKGWLLDDIGKLDRFDSYAQSRDHILAAVRPDNRAAVEERLEQAGMLRAATLAAAGGLTGRLADEKAQACRTVMGQVYAMVQESRPGEMRGFWCHYGSGPMIEGKRASWGKAIPMIADGGMNAIFPNMLFPGVAYYQSKVVPTHPIVAEAGDQLAACIKECRKRGVQVHVWKVCWEVGWQAAQDAAEPFRAENRLQVDTSGRTSPVLCPSDPRNRKYELDAILEAADYDIDGIHLDYIRYRGPNVCFCDGCRQRFEAKTGEPVANWPADAAPGGPRAAAYADFKCEQITSFVREVRHALKAKKPNLKLSAAVWEPAPSALRVSQDWPAWVDEGLLDFVCPMIYTQDMAYFRGTLGEIVTRVAGRAQVCPGIMAQARRRPDGQPPLDILVDEIKAARELGAAGFVFFELRESHGPYLMPYMKAGVASKP